MSRILFTFAIIYMAMYVAMAFAQAKYPVKLRFENITHQQVSMLLNKPGVPAIIASSWQAAHEKFYEKPPEGKIANYDLNQDGTEEMILYLSGGGMCSRGGCHLIFFQFDPENERLGYKTARSGSADILILDTLSSNGYHNIAISPMDSMTSSMYKDYVLYRWEKDDLKQTDEIIRYQHRKEQDD